MKPPSAVRLMCPVCVLVCALVCGVGAAGVAGAQPADMRIGIIGLDTSHVVAFTKSLAFAV